MATLQVHYSYGLIAVSVLISILAAYTAFSLAERMRQAADPLHRQLWLLGGSLAMGLGIWSMHYLGMLAVELPIDVYYHVPTVILSLLLASAASAVALTIVSSDKLGWSQLVVGGVLMGSGIGAMHYVGMAAMRFSAMESYSRRIVLLSIVVAVSASIMALWVGFAVRRKTQAGIMRGLAGTIMGLGIAAMHYTAMAAVTFHASTMPFSTAWTIRVNSLLEFAVIVITGLVLLTAISTASFEKKRFMLLNDAHQELAASQEKLLEVERQLREANALLSELSIRDGLTGLYNRRHFDAVIDTEWRRARRANGFIALLMVDVDCFKALNDTYGHQRGDECLREIARVLETQPRRSHDVVARYGGEEFVVLLPGASVGGALRAAEAIRLAIRELNIQNAGTAEGFITVSIGVSSRRPQRSDEVDTLVQAADTALYGAKQLGRNRVEIAGEIQVEA